jgi:2-oxoacid:acceptor oxidoreductase gamma subunit (pyruvate/2-ketoisovalerate family)
MIEIRFHGRGGQGAVTAANILANAYAMEGNDVQAFPYFGVERRGAPVTAYCRADRKPIRVKAAVYEPKYVIVLDPSLLGYVDFTEGLKEDGMVLLNNSKKPSELKKTWNARTATVDSTSIAIENRLGSKSAPIVNTAILGAFARISGTVSIESIENAIREMVPRMTEENARAAHQSYDKVNME